MSLNYRKKDPEPKDMPKWLPPVLWAAALLCVFFMGIVIAQRTPVIRGLETKQTGPVDNSYAESIASDPALPEMNALVTEKDTESIERMAAAVTYKPENQREGPVTYTIEAGDSIFGIANEFDLEPETILWANYNVLHDDAHNILSAMN